jgi:transcription antitermination factor NusG
MEKLSPEIFEYFQEPRSRSNVWSRQRLELKQKLVAFAGTFHDAFHLSDLDLDITASDHYPSLWNSKCVDRQWIFFSRGKESRKIVEEVIDVKRTLSSTITDPTPYFKNVFIGLDVNAETVGMAVCLHWKAWVDRDNFLGRLEVPEERRRWIDIVGSLHEEYLLKVDGMPPLPVAEADEESLAPCIEQFRSSAGFWSTGLFVPKDQALQLGEDIWEVVKIAFMLLIPVYEFTAWSPENDFISMSEKRREAEEKKLEAARLHEREQEAFKALKEREKLEQSRRRRLLVEEQKELQGASARVAGDRSRVPQRKEKERPRVDSIAESRARKAEGKLPSRETAPKERKEKPREREIRGAPAGPAAEPRKEIAARPQGLGYGDRVRITDGVLRGKLGVVQEVDGKGSVKVILGSMVARLSISQVRSTRST